VGQKVHPYGFRLGYNKDWHSHWFSKKQYGEYLLEDLKLKRNLKGRFAGAGVSHIDVERAANRLKIIIYTRAPALSSGARARRSISSRPTSPRAPGGKCWSRFRKFTSRN
jgi:small subunit ribosomal protein S3